MGNRNSSSGGEHESLAPSSNRPDSNSSAIEAVTPFTPPSWPTPPSIVNQQQQSLPTGGSSLAAQLNTTTLGLSRAAAVAANNNRSVTVNIHNNNNNTNTNNNNNGNNVKSAKNGTNGTIRASELPATGTVERLKRFFSSNNNNNNSNDSSSTPSNTTTSWLPMPFASTTEEPAGCVSSLSRRQRLTGFIFCFALGCVCSLLSSMYVPMIVVKPAKFAFPYTLGNLLSIGSTTFLIGPCAQVKSMFAPVRLVSSIVYIASMFLTLYCALGLRMAIPTLASIIVQIAAMIWSSATYIPYGRDILWGCLTKTCSCLRIFC